MMIGRRKKHSSDIDKTKKALSDKQRKKKDQKKKTKIPDALQEQFEKPLTSIHCPQSIKADGLSKVKKNPEIYIEINMITKNRMVDNFYILCDITSFKYRKETYTINEKRLYLLPSKSGFFMLTSFYKEGTKDARNFQKTNKGITSKALTLLYNERLYLYLLSSDEKKYNLFIAVFSIAILICYGVGIYFVFK